jgi:hypothetical protein
LGSAETETKGGCDAVAKMESAAGWLRAECSDDGEVPPAALFSVAGTDNTCLFPLLLFLLLLSSSPLRFLFVSEAEAKVGRGCDVVWTGRGAAVEPRLL